MKRRLLALFLVISLLLTGCSFQVEDIHNFLGGMLHKVGIQLPRYEHPTTGPVTRPTEGEEPTGTGATNARPTEPQQTVPMETNPVPTEPEATMRPTQPTVVPTEPEIPAITYSIDVWVADPIVALTEQQIRDFNNNNPYGIYFDANVQGHSESDATYEFMNYPDAVGDLYCFIQDQTGRLVSLGGLSPLDAETAQWVSNENLDASVRGVELGGLLYGYPMSSDNGYFMYYDKSVISENDVDSLEALIAACENSGRGFSFELENSWYTASFFFATGCVSEWTVDDSGNFTSLTDTFNSPEGIIAARGMQKLLTSSCYVNSSMTYDFEATIPSAIVVSGVWNYDHAKAVLGDNLGIADLPSFTVDGESFHLSSFSGSKYLGVKPQADPEKEAALHLLAQYLTAYDAQLERFEERQWCPSNARAYGSDAIASAPHLQALSQQNRYAVPQGMIHGSWWDIARVIAVNIKEGVEPAEALQWYEDALKNLFQLEEDRYAWGVIGAIEGTSWDHDFPMVSLGDGVWISENAFYMEARTEFKVRQGKSWNVNYGADGQRDGPNFVVEVTGTYYVVFDEYTGIISLVSA